MGTEFSFIGSVGPILSNEIFTINPNQSQSGLGDYPLWGFPHASLTLKQWSLVQKLKKNPFLAQRQPLRSNVLWVDGESMLPAGLLLVSLQVTDNGWFNRDNFVSAAGLMKELEGLFSVKGEDKRIWSV